MRICIYLCVDAFQHGFVMLNCCAKKN